MWRLLADPQEMSSSPLLSPSSFPSPPSPPSPFSRLPTELVQSIIEDTALNHYHPDTYFSRQSTLYSLCLVSRQFHQIAKPLLYAVVYRYYGTNTDFEDPLLRGGNAGSEGSVEGLIYEIAVECSKEPPDELMHAIERKVGLRSLVFKFTSFAGVDLADLSELISESEYSSQMYRFVLG